MALFKCKMCGGSLEINNDSTIATCEYCGTQQTIPHVRDEQREAAFNRGNHFRRIGEFDNALAVYERIVSEDDTDAEAHWCCALCRFGIEYVEDPATLEYIPTCHRASFDNFLDDVDYLAALKYSEGITKRQYQKDANKIAEVQRGILATSQNEDPFDVFICYKESDENGQRTRDSMMAQEVYYQLVDQGYRVFFSRITLEDLVGRQYEPYIFAALNSAKVMIVIGTKAEYFNAVWVKNEWSRFLAMMKKDHSKLLLPCYRDMDPYDIPDQLSVLQCYDMAKIGFIQDLIRGVKKVIDADKKPEPVKEAVVQQSASGNVAALLKRVEIFLDDRDWDNADTYCEKVLDVDPTNGKAYYYKFLVEAKARGGDDVLSSRVPLDGMRTFRNAVRYADEATAEKLNKWNKAVNERLAREREARLKRERHNAEHTRLTDSLQQLNGLLRAQKNEKESLEGQLADSIYREQNLTNTKRKICVPAILALANAVVLYFMYSIGTDTAFTIFSLSFIAQFVFSMILANARGNSMGGAFAMTLFSGGFLPAISAIRGLIEAGRLSNKELKEEQEMLAQCIRNKEERILVTQRDITEVNQELRELERQ